MPLKKITDIKTLIDWLADKLLEQEPQGRIPDKLAELFQDFVDSLKDNGFTDGVMLRENLIRVLGSSQKTVQGSLQLADFMASCDSLQFYDAESGRNDAAPAFCYFATRHLGIKDLPQCEAYGGFIRSTLRFEKREGIMIRVTGLLDHIERVNGLTMV